MKATGTEERVPDKTYSRHRPYHPSQLAPDSALHAAALTLIWRGYSRVLKMAAVVSVRTLCLLSQTDRVGAASSAFLRDHPRPAGCTQWQTMHRRMVAIMCPHASAPAPTVHAAEASCRDDSPGYSY